MTTSERFWAKVQVTESCWVWTAAMDGHGYGAFWYQRKVAKAYRAAYEMFVGPVPEGMQLDHLCRNRACVNPAHLEPVSQQVNIARGASPSAISVRTNACSRGHDLSSAAVRRPDGRRYCGECRRATYVQKPCIGCGGVKGPGERLRYCPACREARAS